MSGIEIREVLPGEYEDTGCLTQRAYAEYARPGGPPWEDHFGVLADVAGRVRFATVLVAVAGRRIAGTATAELDRTIGGTGGLQPGQANVRLAVDPGASRGRQLAEACVQVARRAGKQTSPCTPPSRWRPHSVSTGRRASSAIGLATLSCTPI